MLKLNCGSGGLRLPDWINLDIDPANAPDVLADLGQCIPFPDGSAAYIHSEDFLSCLPEIDAVRRFLSEAHRVLVPGGVMRLLLPSLERLVAAYQLRPEWLIEQWQRGVGLPLDPKTGGHLLNLAIKLNPGFMFDRSTLALLLQEADFALREVGYNDSPYPALRGLDNRRPDQSVSMYLECDRLDGGC